LYRRLDKKEYKRTRRGFRSEVPLPNPDICGLEPMSAVSHRPSMPPPPQMVDFSTPTSPMMAAMRLQMHDRNGVHVDSSDEDRNDDSIWKSVDDCVVTLSLQICLFFVFLAMICLL
jgi:hypothetical protein